MQKLQIGVMDKEKVYVVQLTTYLQRYGKGRWELFAFTEEEKLQQYLDKHSLDILIDTDKKRLLKEQALQNIVRLWLTDETGTLQKENAFYRVYRFQNAREIAKNIDHIIQQEGMKRVQSKRMVAFYSPVGRCGKTTLALEIVQSGLYGNWLYFGMEDYSSFTDNIENRESVAEEILYYWKEHKDKKLLSSLEKSDSLLTVGTSYLDVKQLTMEDWKWFREVFEQSQYRGVLFDLGSGVLQSLQVLQSFDFIVVPCLEEECAKKKLDNFKRVLKRQSVEWKEGKMCFFNMENSEEGREWLKKTLQE